MVEITIYLDMPGECTLQETGIKKSASARTRSVGPTAAVAAPTVDDEHLTRAESEAAFQYFHFIAVAAGDVDFGILL